MFKKNKKKTPFGISTSINKIAAIAATDLRNYKIKGKK